MKTWVALLVGFLATTKGWGEETPEWVATLQPPAAGSFAPLRAFTAKYSFGWSALSAGEAEVEVSRKPGQSQLKVRGGTGGAVRAMWKLDSDATSTVRAQDLQTVRLVQIEKYSDEKRTTTVVFGTEGVARTRVREPKDKDSGKTKRFKFAPVRDLHGSLLFVRSQPLQQGDVVRFVVYPDSGGYLAEAEVIGREKIKVAGKEWPAIKLALRLKEIAKDLTLKPHQKFKSATCWLSDDADRLLLKVEADVMVGKVWMALQQINFTNPSGGR